MSFDLSTFEERLHEQQDNRPGDHRDPYQRDRARIMHSAAFRRLQGKTQVMGVGEGDFHRTRLTHSIEVAQIASGILGTLNSKIGQLPKEVGDWLPSRDLIEAAGFAHDLGHPPFGHKGEQALHEAMQRFGGFEGNGQTLRVLSRLEKYKEQGRGIFPTRRLLLGILKYPVPMDAFDRGKHKSKPPKCFHVEERGIVSWILEPFSSDDKKEFQSLASGKSKYHSLDCSILELADDIAYGIHDIEDIVARKLATEKEIVDSITEAFDSIGGAIMHDDVSFTAKSVSDNLLGNGFTRKQQVASLVNLFVTNVEFRTVRKFEHPLLRFNASLPAVHMELLSKLKGLSYELVIKKAKVQQLELRGKLIVSELFRVLSSNPECLIPSGSWEDGCLDSTKERRVCDYIAGMTDAYAEKTYKRLFQPGFGSSGDEL